MHKEGIKGFPYYVGVNSLAELATKKDKVCVLNITGNESKAVTPTSHEYSGGNIVFGTSPGRSGQFVETKKGKIPVYNSVKEGIEAGHKFNTAVIYLPPTAVKDGVAEVVRHNPGLKKIIILTEKVAIADSRIIRAVCQANGVDVFGANCLGLADSWNKVRLGGALGGNAPEESLVKGSVAIFSNSGNFTTTMAVYLLTKGWGTTTSVSSGKDVYIQYGPREFFHALNNDDRSKCAVIYSEPGGYYEHGLNITKPTVACVVGRWKAKLTKACGHAGSLAGTGDDAAAKEDWFKEYFGVDDIYTPENPVVSKKGAVVINISHIPEAMSAVMKLNGVEPDFAPNGDLSPKCWFASNAGLKLPANIDIPAVTAMEPYDEQIERVTSQVGAQLPRQAMKDTSGASMMDPKTQVSKIHGLSILDASKKSLEENLVMSVVKSYPDETGRKLANLAFNGFVNQAGEPTLAAAEASRKAENSPNTVLSSAVAIIGKGSLHGALEVSQVIFDKFTTDDNPDASKLSTKELKAFKGSSKDLELGKALLAKAKAIKSSKFFDFVDKASDGNPSSGAVLSAIWSEIAFDKLVDKTISKYSFLNLPWYSRVYSTFVGCSVPAKFQKKNSFHGFSDDELTSMSFTDTAFVALLGRKPNADELFEFSMLLGLIITNGPGTISAQGCKGGVSADGPEDPSRVQINKGFIGFLTHTGFAHGGNGYEAVAFLIDRFKKSGLADASDAKHGVDLKAVADKYSKFYADYKAKQKAIGSLDYAKVPCVNHPIFKGKAVNYDPRERFVTELFKDRGIYNAFLDFYSTLVNSLYEAKVTKNVYCVNVDAVIAVILLKIVWKSFVNKEINEKDIESAGFTTFLFGRMIGCGAEIDDHINRGKNMDTRTAASKCKFVS